MCLETNNNVRFKPNDRLRQCSHCDKSTELSELASATVVSYMAVHVLVIEVLVLMLNMINNQEAVLPSEREAFVDAIKHAVDVGYRHFDCSMLYGNEAEIGKGLRSKIEEGVVKREELFIVSKEGDGYFPKDATGKIIPGTEDYVDTWRAMEECVQLGLTKAIGVSNFNKRQLERLMAASTTVPAVNQIESHPYLSQTKQIDYCKSKGIAVTAYSPLGSPAGKSSRFFSQIQRGVICIPKSSNKNRMKSNFEVFDFEMSPEDIEEMTKLDCNGRYVALEE
ncbi:NADP-dependent oxidoreductase domain [Trinorchestia longiramus]|nr:NADP-dependent oxidoreductase domain [Trinorchestia longiramus]